MGWLDQIRARRAARGGPDSGTSVFENYEFTEDRRERAARARSETGVASNLFANALQEQVVAEPATDPGPVQPVHLEGDEIDPEAAGPVERGAPRRSAKRIRAPLELYYFPTPDHFVPLELTVIYRDGGTKAVDCFLYDVNDSGIGFAAPELFAEGSELTVLGAHAEDLTPLIATDVTIVNNRPYPADKGMPEKFSGRQLWLHGTRMEIHDALLLYKATLDSIALAVALQKAPDEDDVTDEDGDGDGDGEKTPDEISG